LPLLDRGGPRRPRAPPPAALCDRRGADRPADRPGDRRARQPRHADTGHLLAARQRGSQDPLRPRARGHGPRRRRRLDPADLRAADRGDRRMIVDTTDPFRLASAILLVVVMIPLAAICWRLIVGPTVVDR